MRAPHCRPVMTSHELEVALIGLAIASGPFPFDAEQAAALVGLVERSANRAQILDRLAALVPAEVT